MYEAPIAILVNQHIFECDFYTAIVCCDNTRKNESIFYDWVNCQIYTGILGNRLKAPDKKPPGQNPPDNKPPRIIEEIIVKYAVDANLFQLGSTNPKKKYPAPRC